MNISWFHDNFLITYYYSYASAMKQVPTNVPLHSLSSLSKADLSVYDSVDDQVLNDYAVSHPSNPFAATQRFFLAIQHDRFDLCLDQGKLRFWTRCPYGFYGRCFQECRWYDWQTYSLIQQNASSRKYNRPQKPWNWPWHLLEVCDQFERHFGQFKEP